MALPLASSAIVRDPRVTVLSRPHFVEPAHLPVQWVGDATAGEQLAEYAGRLCHMSQRNPAERSTREFLENIKKQGHGSVLEHANYSLLVEGVSRALSHELVRHRAGFAYSQLSPHAGDEREVRFVLPPAIVGDEALEATWSGQMALALERYRELVDAVMTRHGWIDDKVQRRRMARDAARSVLPNSTEAKIVVTGNARAWRFLLEAHASETADLEFRRLAVAVLQVLQREAPGFFSDFEIYQAPDRRDAARAAYHKV
jgi:thymidylate synthase (FAD)